MSLNKNNSIPIYSVFDAGNIEVTLIARIAQYVFRAIAFGLLLAVMLLSPKKAGATTYVWNGPSNSSWNSAANWLPSTGYPGSGSSAVDTAIINSSNVTINYADNVSIAALESTTLGVSGITIHFTGTTPSLVITSLLSIAAPYTATIGISFTGTGVLTFNGTATFNYRAGLFIGAGTTFDFTAGSIFNFNNNNGILSNAGTLSCDSCTFNFNGAIANTGTLALSNKAYADFEGATSYIDNSGTFSVDSSTVKLGNNLNYIQNAGASSTMTALSSTFDVAGAFAFINNVTSFTASACTFNFGNSGYFQNTGSTAIFNAQSACAFNLSSSLSYIDNSGVYNDHGSTYALTGQSAYIQNDGAAGNMHMSGSVINIIGIIGNSQILNNTATFKADSGALISLNTFSSVITNSGSFYAGISGSLCTVTLNGQASSLTNYGNFFVGPASIIYPTAVVAAVSNVSPGVFTLQSDSTGSAAIGPMNSTGGGLQATCAGIFNVERYFQGSLVYDHLKNRWLARAYRILSSPVNTGTPVGGNNVFGLNYIVGATAGLTTTANSTTNAFVTGASGGSTNIGNPSLFLFRENRAVNNSSYSSGNFIGITDITSPGALVTTDGGTSTIPAGNGVLFYFRGAATNWTARTSAPYIAPENVTLTATGSINQQAVTVSNWYTPSSPNIGFTSTAGNTSVQGYNLVGNPYPCSIDWNSINSGGITATNINPTIYVFNPFTNQYDSYTSTGSTSGIGTGSATNIIASGQGFFVRTNSANPALVFNETAKVATAQPTGANLLMGTPANSQTTFNQLIRLKLSIDSINYDDIALGFNANTSPKYNSNEDSEYMPGMNAPEGLASFSCDSMALSVNFQPFPKRAPLVIRLKIVAANSGRFDLKQTAFANIPPIYEAWLMDNLKKDSLDIRNNTDYLFDIDKTDTTTFGSNRFTVVIRQNHALMVHLLSFTGTKATGGAQLVWLVENEQDYTNFTTERSTDNGATFSALGGMTSNAQGTYSFLDRDPVNGIDIYRLKITDLNGSISYSTPVSLNYGDQNTPIASRVNVYPNPALNVITLSVNQPVTAPLMASNPGHIPGLVNAAPGVTTSGLYDIKIVNISGAVIKTASATSANWQTNVNALSPGSYIIQVVNSGDKSLVGVSTFIKL